MMLVKILCLIYGFEFFLLSVFAFFEPPHFLLKPHHKLNALAKSFRWINFDPSIISVVEVTFFFFN